ncbi:E3 ubiquitin-protein ligase RLIM-like [Suncus etruscus]|uniref:E3 ubiquitin-protein ligase RLIM-like n=1 Tax=Suncus etruscus TaxID=109475 RepID=UPI00210FC0B8|nr:E3 ubiquitin-protein ligase RLIM-like [Suncus etruscus]
MGPGSFLIHPLALANSICKIFFIIVQIPYIYNSLNVLYLLKSIKRIFTEGTQPFLPGIPTFHRPLPELPNRHRKSEESPRYVTHDSNVVAILQWNAIDSSSKAEYRDAFLKHHAVTFWKHFKMERSDLEDEEVSASQCNKQRRTLTLEEKSVSLMSEDDQKLMRDNNLLGNPDTEFSSHHDSMLQRLGSFEEIENMTYEERENPFLREVSLEHNQSSKVYRCSLGRCFSLYENTDQEVEYASFARCPSRENLKDCQRQVQILPSESTTARPNRSEQCTNEVLSDDLLTRDWKRARSRSPEYTRSRQRTDNSSGISRASELLDRVHYNLSGLSVHTPEAEHEDDIFSITQQEEMQRQEITEFEFHESRRLQQINSTIFSNSELEVQPTASSQRDSVASRTNLISNRKIDNAISESEQGELPETLSQFWQAEIQSSAGLSFNNLTTSLTNTPSFLIENPVRHTSTGYSDPDVLVGDSEVGTSMSYPIQHMEGAESSNGCTISGLSHSSTTNTDHTYHLRTNTTPVSSSNIHDENSSSVSPNTSMNYSDESSNDGSLIVWSPENSLSPNTVSDILHGLRPASPLFDDSDSWSSPDLDEIILFDEEEDNELEPRGLTREQIDMLAIRSFGESDDVKTCSVCITEFIEGSKICTLPCLHEYHFHCIDNWLLQHTTCPICRKTVVNTDE